MFNGKMNRRRALTTSHRASLSAIIVCVAAGSLFVGVTPASSVPPREYSPSTGAHRYPAAFERFMAVQFGDLWMHTVQEQVIRRMFVTWQDKQKR